MCGIPATYSAGPISFQILTQNFYGFLQILLPEKYINLVDDAYSFSTSL